MDIKGPVITFIIYIVFSAISNYNKQKKENEKRKADNFDNPVPLPKPNRTKPKKAVVTKHRSLSEEFARRKEGIPKKTYTHETLETTKGLEDNEEMDHFKKHEYAVYQTHEEKAIENSANNLKQQEEIALFQTDEEVRKAFIYSEIFKPKYF